MGDNNHSKGKPLKADVQVIHGLYSTHKTVADRICAHETRQRGNPPLGEIRARCGISGYKRRALPDILERDAYNSNFEVFGVSGTFRPSRLPMWRRYQLNPLNLENAFPSWISSRQSRENLPRGRMGRLGLGDKRRRNFRASSLSTLLSSRIRSREWTCWADRNCSSTDIGFPLRDFGFNGITALQMVIGDSWCRGMD